MSNADKLLLSTINAQKEQLALGEIALSLKTKQVTELSTRVADLQKIARIKSNKLDTSSFVTMLEQRDIVIRELKEELKAAKDGKQDMYIRRAKIPKQGENCIVRTNSEFVALQKKIIDLENKVLSERIAHARTKAWQTTQLSVINEYEDQISDLCKKLKSQEEEIGARTRWLDNEEKSRNQKFDRLLNSFYLFVSMYVTSLNKNFVEASMEKLETYIQKNGTDRLKEGEDVSLEYDMLRQRFEVLHDMYKTKESDLKDREDLIGTSERALSIQWKILIKNMEYVKKLELESRLKVVDAETSVENIIATTSLEGSKRIAARAKVFTDYMNEWTEAHRDDGSTETFALIREHFNMAKLEFARLVAETDSIKMHSKQMIDRKNTEIDVIKTELEFQKTSAKFLYQIIADSTEQIQLRDTVMDRFRDVFIKFVSYPMVRNPTNHPSGDEMDWQTNAAYLQKYALREKVEKLNKHLKDISDKVNRTSIVLNLEEERTKRLFNTTSLDAPPPSPPAPPATPEPSMATNSDITATSVAPGLAAPSTSDVLM